MRRRIRSNSILSSQTIIQREIEIMLNYTHY